MDTIKNSVGASRLNGFDKPTVWTIMTPLAIKTQSANLVRFISHRGKAFRHGNLHHFSSATFNKQPKQVKMILTKAIINMSELMVH